MIFRYSFVDGREATEYMDSFDKIRVIGFLFQQYEYEVF